MKKAGCEKKGSALAFTSVDGGSRKPAASRKHAENRHGGLGALGEEHAAVRLRGCAPQAEERGRRRLRRRPCLGGGRTTRGPKWLRLYFMLQKGSAFRTSDPHPQVTSPPGPDPPKGVRSDACATARAIGRGAGRSGGSREREAAALDRRRLRLGGNAADGAGLRDTRAARTSAKAQSPPVRFARSPPVCPPRSRAHAPSSRVRARTSHSACDCRL